jgi:hypothetical protein
MNYRIAAFVDVRACTPYEDACDDQNKMNVSDKIVCDECSVCHTDLCNGQGLFKIDTTEKPDSKEESTKSAKPGMSVLIYTSKFFPWICRKNRADAK